MKTLLLVLALVLLCASVQSSRHKLHNKAHKAYVEPEINKKVDEDQNPIIFEQQQGIQQQGFLDTRFSIKNKNYEEDPEIGTSKLANNNPTIMSSPVNNNNIHNNIIKNIENNNQNNLGNKEKEEEKSDIDIEFIQEKVPKMLSFIDFIAYSMNDHHNLDEQQKMFFQKLLQFNTKVQQDSKVSSLFLVKQLQEKISIFATQYPQYSRLIQLNQQIVDQETQSQKEEEQKQRQLKQLQYQQEQYQLQLQQQQQKLEQQKQQELQQKQQNFIQQQLFEKQQQQQQQQQQTQQNEQHQQQKGQEQQQEKQQPNQSEQLEQQIQRQIEESVQEKMKKINLEWKNNFDNLQKDFNQQISQDSNKMNKEINELNQQVQLLNKNQDLFSKQQALLINYLQKNFTQEQEKLQIKQPLPLIQNIQNNVTQKKPKSQMEMQLENYLKTAYRFKQINDQNEEIKTFKDKKQYISCQSENVDKLELEIREYRNQYNIQIKKDEKLQQKLDRMEKCKEQLKLENDLQQLQYNLQNKQLKKVEVMQIFQRLKNEKVKELKTEQEKQLQQFQQQYLYYTSDKNIKNQFIQIYNLSIQIQYFCQLLLS